MKKKLILILILALGILLRTIFVNSSPPSLYGDELTITLDAYSIFKTGHDQLGNFLPLTFPMGAGRPAGYVYFTIPFVAIFGPAALGARGLSILSGIGLILLIYLALKKTFSERVGIIAAALYAVSLWDISLSRGGFEAHFALFLVILGLYLFLEAKEKPIFYLFSAISFGLTFHTYPTYKLNLLWFLPLLFIFGGAKTTLDYGKNYLFGGLIILLILGILSLSQTFVGGSETRFLNINVFSQVKLKSNIEEKINFERTINKLPNNITRFFHNKPVEYIKVIGENYLQNFSMDFLFIHGDRNPRHNMATMGELYFMEIILIPLGMLYLWNKYRKILMFLIIWLILAPISTAIVGLPHALRSSFMLPPLITLSALGLSIIIRQKTLIPLFITSIFFVIQVTFFLQKLLFLAPYEYNSFWSYPAKLGSELAIQNKDKYDYIFLSDRLDSVEFAYPVYARVDPKDIIDRNNNKINLGKYTFKKFGNVYIGNIPNQEIDNFLDNLRARVLYLGDLTDLKYLKSYETINGVDNTNSLVLTKRNL